MSNIRTQRQLHIAFLSQNKFSLLEGADEQTCEQPLWLVRFVSTPALTTTSPIGSLFMDHRASVHTYVDLQRTIYIKVGDPFISELNSLTIKNSYDLGRETRGSCSRTLSQYSGRQGLALAHLQPFYLDKNEVISLTTFPRYSGIKATLELKKQCEAAGYRFRNRLNPIRRFI